MTPVDYRNAAIERIGDAQGLRRLARYTFAMYAAGVASECMLRAFRHPDREHDARHDVVRLLYACQRSWLGERAWARLRAPVQVVHGLWLNNLRYTHEQHLRQHLRDIKYYTRTRRGTDTLKAACVELVDAATRIVSLGDERWRNL